MANSAEGRGTPGGIREVFQTMIDGLYKLEILAVEGHSDSQEADVLRDSLDVVWWGLTHDEKEEIDRISEEIRASRERTEAEQAS